MRKDIHEKRPYQICTNCVMDTTDPNIVFDEHGVCDMCNNYYNVLLPNWERTRGRLDLLEQLAKKIREEGKGKKYDCIIGLSGGVDSSYLGYVAKEIMQLRPLVYVVDTGWNLEVAESNIEKLVTSLNLDIYTEKIDWEEMKDLQLAFLRAQVPGQDAPQDTAIFSGLYNYAVKHHIKYVLTGANTATEGIRPPLAWIGLNDVRFKKAIHKKYGKVKLKTFPMCSMFKYKLLYELILGMKRVAPLDYINYDKSAAEKELHERFGWEKYENKHYENVFTRFYEGYYLPHKFGIDKRKCYFSNQILAGTMSREDALKLLAQDPYPREVVKQDMEYIASRLGISYDELNAIIEGENKRYEDYKTLNC